VPPVHQRIAPECLGYVAVRALGEVVVDIVDGAVQLLAVVLVVVGLLLSRSATIRRADVASA